MSAAEPTKGTQDTKAAAAKLLSIFDSGTYPRQKPSDPGWLAREEGKECIAVLVAQAERASELEAALRELVALKDGPRDADYESRKPLAWAEARRLAEGREGQ